jgi:hypothetical protein
MWRNSIGAPCGDRRLCSFLVLQRFDADAQQRGKFALGQVIAFTDLLDIGGSDLEEMLN